MKTETATEPTGHDAALVPEPFMGDWIIAPHPWTGRCPDCGAVAVFRRRSPESLAEPVWRRGREGAGGRRDRAAIRLVRLPVDGIVETRGRQREATHSEPEGGCLGDSP